MELDIVTTITLLKGLVVKRLSFFLHIFGHQGGAYTQEDLFGFPSHLPQVAKYARVN